MNLDPRSDRIIDLANEIAGGDHVQAYELLVSALCRWSTRFAGCAILLGMAIDLLQAAKDAAETYRRERSS